MVTYLLVKYIFSTSYSVVLYSSNLLLLQTGVYEVITGLTAEAKYQPLIPYNGPFLPGEGPQQDIFPAHRDVNFFMTFTSGQLKHQFHSQSIHLTMFYHKSIMLSFLQ